LYRVLLAAEGAGDYKVLGTHSFTGKGRDSPVTFRVTRGDYSPIMQRIVDNLIKAQVQHILTTAKVGNIVEGLLYLRVGHITTSFSAKSAGILLRNCCI
jgi:hypothetical protein